MLQSEGKGAFPEQELATYLERYDKLVDEGLAANPIPESIPGKRGRKAKGKFRCLLERFREFKNDILRFTRDWRVPYTNNTAETAAKPPATSDSLRKGQGEGFRVLPHQIRRR